MDKRIAYYTLSKRGEMWNNIIIKQFEGNLSKHGVFFFDEGTVKETEFQKQCAKLSITVNRKIVTKSTGKDLYSHPFHYLTVKPDRDCYEVERFMDYENVCSGGGQLFCKTNVLQKKKVIIDLNKSKKLDIMTVPNIHKPKIFLISRKIKKLLEKMDFSGYRLIPCLANNKNYSDLDTQLEVKSGSIDIDKDTHYFQMIITNKVHHPPYVGHVTRIFSQCPVCKTVYGFDSDRTPYFSSGGLQDTDFQLFSEYRTVDNQKFQIQGEIAIISSRVIRTLIENKVTGLSNYLTDPPVKYGVVEIDLE